MTGADETPHRTRANHGQVALVTGASRGIGRAIAIALAARGMRIAVHYHSNRAAAEQTLKLLDGSGHLPVSADLGDASAAEQLVGSVEDQLGPISVLVNNAGVIEEHPPLSTPFAQWQAAWRRTIETNLYAPAHLSVLAAQRMAGREPLPQGRGRIVNVSSRGAFRGEPDAPAYGASKAGLNALGQSLALALAPRAIYVFGIAPGWVATDMATGYLDGPRGARILAQHPLGRVATPAEVAAAVAYCALDAPAAMTGAIIDVNGASYLRT